MSPWVPTAAPATTTWILFGEMDSCAKLHKVASMDPTVLPAQVVLRMATRNGARALGLEGRGEK